MEQNNNIENFFKKKYSEPVQEQDWNTPSEDSWDNILDGLEEPKRKRSIAAFLPWLLGGIGLFLGIYLIVSNQNQSERIDHLENKINDIGENTIKDTKTIGKKELGEISGLEIEENAKARIENQTEIGINAKRSVAQVDKNKENKIIKAASVINNVYNKTESAAKVNTPKPKNPIGERSITFDAHEKSMTNNNSPTSNLPVGSNRLNTKDSKFNVGLSDEDSEESQHSISQNQSNYSIDSPNHQNEKIELIKLLTLTQMLFSIQERPHADLINTETKILSKQKNNSIYLGLTTRYNQWFDVSTGMVDNELEQLKTSDGTLPSFAFGINSSIAVGNKWTLNIGALYNQRSHESIYQTDVFLSRSQSSTVSNDEIVGIDLSFKTVTKSIIIPVSTSFFPKSANNGLYFSGGLVNEIITSSGLSGIQTHSQHDQVKDESINIVYDQSQQKKYDIGASVGLGYVWNFKQDFNLTLGANYDFGLSNHYVDNEFEHRLNNLSLGLQVMKAISK